MLLRKAGNEYYCALRTSRETLFYTGHWLKLRFTKQFLASIRNLHFIPTSRRDILPSNFCSSRTEQGGGRGEGGGGQVFTKAMYPEKMENILQGARSARISPFYILEGKEPFPFILVFFHPFLSSSSHLSFFLSFLFQFLLFLPPHTMPKPGPRWWNRGKALVALPFFPILLLYCLSRCSRLEWIRLTARLLAIVINQSIFLRLVNTLHRAI